MRRVYLLCLSLLCAGLWACSDDTTSPTSHDRTPPATLPKPSYAAAPWGAKYPLAPSCTNGNALPVNEIILHGEVWEGFPSNGWLQWSRTPLEIAGERQADVEMYSFQGNPFVRCRNGAKVVRWGFYDGTQVPTNTLFQSLNATNTTVQFNPSAFTQPGDGIQILTSDGLWEIGRDHWVAKAYPRQLSNGATVLDTIADTLIVDAVIQWPAGCPPEQHEDPKCRP